MTEPRTKVWIPHSHDGWLSGEVIGPNPTGGMKCVSDEGDEYIVPPEQIRLQNPSMLDGVDDMTTLSYLHEPAILHNLATRCGLGTIYTYTGTILIAINPYCKLSIYTKEMIDAYCGQPVGKLPPHVFAVAESTYRDMLTNGTNQSILVSGESGAGKTETTKFLLSYFAAMAEKSKLGDSSGSIPAPSSPTAAAFSPPLNNYSPVTSSRSPHAHRQHSENGIKPVNANIETQVLESTPILEAFGNAKTLRNDNSSRFGKFIEIQFDSGKGTIVGAKIRTYLLEKSRIVKPPEGERNYHIFYQLLAGTTPEEKKKYFLDIVPSDEGLSHGFQYLISSSCHTIPDVDDGEVFRTITKRAFKSLNFTDEEMKSVCTILAAVLHLGNITFEETGKNDESRLIERSSVYNPVSIAASLLSVDVEVLKKVIITRKMVAGNETYTIPLKPQQCCEARDSLAMLLYSRLFDWLVVRINQSIVNPTEGLTFIGVLDIYGFEFFETNSFEQFTINYANEKLQQQFNQQIFKLEQQEYTKEKIDWSYIEFHDNQECVDLIEKKPIGILSLLDEETQFPKSNALTLATKLFNNLLGKTKHFEKPRFSNIQFTVDHYAGKVTYDTTSFLEKNKDFVVPEQVQLLEKSGLSFIKHLLPAKSAQASGKSKSNFQFLSVASQFRDSLASLMASIHQTQPNYIRCIKPNTQKKALTFEKPLVLQQLRCGGVLEQLRISRAGYPSRLPYANVMRRYKLLAVNQLPQVLWSNPKKCCEILMETYGIGQEKVQFGLTKLFLRAGIVAQFETMRTQKLHSSAVAIQKNWKRYFYANRYKKMREVAIYIQNCLRKGIARSQLGRLREEFAAVHLQTVIRKYTQAKQYKKLRASAVVLQKAVLSFYAARKFAELKLDTAVTILQSAVRKAQAVRYRRKMLVAIVKAQTRWRGLLARRLYREMKIEARQLSTVIAEKNKLEKKAEELQWRLSAEGLVKTRLEDDNKKLATKAKETEEEIQKKDSELDRAHNKISALEAKLLELQKMLEKERAEKEQEREEKEREKREKEKEREEAEMVRKELDMEKEVSAGLRKKLEEMEKKMEDFASDLEKVKEMREKVQTTGAVVAEFTSPDTSTAAVAVPGSPSLTPIHPFVAHDSLTDAEVEARNQSDPLKTALVIGGNDVDSGKFLVDMVLVNKNEDVPSHFVSGVPEPGFVIFKFLLRKELVPCTVDMKLLSYLIDSFACTIQNINADNDRLSFWLSNVAFMLYMVAKEIKADESQQQITFSADIIFHSTMSQFHYGSPSFDRDQIDQNQLAMIFYSQMKTMLVKIYSCLFRNVTTKISPMLHEALFKYNANIEMMEHITNYLTQILTLFQQNFVYISLVQQFFEQIFFYMNCVIFNEILLRRDLNSLVRGIDLKMKIAELESWASSNAKEWVGNATQQLKHTQQTISILIINKTLLESSDFRAEICPDLSPAQLKQLLSLYTPDPDSFEEPIPIRVLQSILKSAHYHPDDRLLLDPAVLRPFPVATLHYLEPFELDRIPYSSATLVTALMKMNIASKIPTKGGSTDDKLKVRKSVKFPGFKL